MSLISNMNGTTLNRSIASNITSSVPRNSSSGYDTLAQGYNPQNAMDVLDQKATNMYDGQGNFTPKETESPMQETEPKDSWTQRFSDPVMETSDFIQQENERKMAEARKADLVRRTARRTTNHR